MRVGVAVVLAFAIAGAAFACEIADPLDDISGGSRDAGKKSTASSSSSSSGSQASASSGSSSSSSSGQTSGDGGGLQPTCNGPHEIEPNESNPTPLSKGISCGVLTGGAADIDDWVFQNDTGSAVSVALLVKAPSSVMVMTRSGGSMTTSNAGNAVTTSVQANQSLLVEISTDTGTDDVAYTIEFSTF